MKKDPSQILDELISLYEKYSRERRATTQPYLLEDVQRKFPSYRYHPSDIVVRETLIEHVGSLPIVASYLFPYIDDPDVDLGKALTMLAIHDIGETVTGDEMTFTKQRKQENDEEVAAIKLLPQQYHDLYLDIEHLRTKTGKFAKSIDKLTPDILDLITPKEITEERIRYFVGEGKSIVNLIKKHKHPFMQWNPFLTEFHLEIIRRLEEKFR